MASDEDEVVGAESPGKDWSVFWSCVWWAPKQLASSVDNLVWWLWGGAGLPAAMDTLNTLLLGWLFSAVLILILVKFLYDKFLRGSDDEDIYSEAGGVQSESHEGISAEQTAAEKSEALARQKREARREATIVPSPSSLPKGSAGPAAGQDADAVRWINTIMQWMFRGPHKAISAPYLALLNDMTAQTALETGVLIEVLEMLPATPSPQLRNVVVDCTPDDNMHLTCDCETMMFLRLQTTRTHREVTTESEYAAAVCPLIGRVNASVRTHQCTATLKFDGWPEVEIELEGIRNNEVGLGEKELQEVIKEVVASAIRSMVLELDLRQDSSFPRFKRARELPDRVMPVGYDSMVRERMTHPPVLKSRAPVKPRDIPSSPSLSAPLPPPAPTGVLNGKRLLVKIVKATGIGSDKSAVDGYVVVEMDEPNQKFTTATVKGSNSPFWDEQFLFDLSDITLELLFELYDESDSSFLGLGIVGIEELVATPSQRQIIPLQSRPYENDAVSGSLTVEFLFLDSTDLPDLTVRCSNIQQDRSPRGEGLVTTVTTTYAKAPLAADVAVNGTDSVAASALRDIERSTGTAPNAKSTIIIHASKKPEDEVMEEEEDDDENYVVNTLQYPFPGSTTGTTSPTTTTTTPYSKPGPTTSQVTTAPADIRDEGIDLEEDERGRGRTKRKRDSFFGTLKKRFSRSKVRSQSVEPTSPQAARETTPGNDMPRTATVGRSVSMERSTRLRPTGLLSVPKLDNRGEIGGRSGGDTGSTRSSVSETSGLSSSSTRTYVNEASMLIVETVENGLVKHYLVPVSLQQRNRWKKRGTKLHVFSGHTFVAKHLSRSLSCAVCEKSFPRRPGKQGYECRDCGLNTHKPCHVRTEVQCPNSKVNNMDLEYITDPREERRNLRNNQRP